MTRLSSNGVRKDFAEALNQVAYKGERVIIHRRGKDTAVLVSLGDLKILEAIEDKFDLEDAKKALEEPGENITLEEVKRRLGL